MQLALLGADEAALVALFDQIVKGANATAFDVLGTDGWRMRSARFNTDRKHAGQSVAINLTSIASPARKFRKPPLSTGAKTALELATMGLDAAIVLGDPQSYQHAIGTATTVSLTVAEPSQFSTALAAAIEAATRA